MSWPSFNIRDLLIATALVAIGLVWPILFFVIVPIIVTGIIARMRFREQMARAVYAVAAIYPWVLLSLIYLTWANAWRRSGSRPIPYETELGLAAPFDSLLFLAIGIMMLGLPVALLLGLASLAMTVQPRWGSLKSERIAKAIIFLLVWIEFVIWSISDPGQAIEWFFD